MGLGSLWWMDELRLELCEDDGVEAEEEDAGVEEVVEDEEEEVVCEVAEAEPELGAMLPIRPVNRPRMGSAHRLLLHVVAGSRVKRPV